MSPVHAFSNDGIRAWELLFSQVFSCPDLGSGPFFRLFPTRDGAGPGARAGRAGVPVDAQGERQDGVGGAVEGAIRSDEGGFGELEGGESHPPGDGNPLPPRNLPEPPRRKPPQPAPRQNVGPYLISIRVCPLNLLSP